jgi:hypothetical protein
LALIDLRDRHCRRPAKGCDDGGDWYRSKRFRERDTQGAIGARIVQDAQDNPAVIEDAAARINVICRRFGSVDYLLPERSKGPRYRSRNAHDNFLRKGPSGQQRDYHDDT